MLEALAFKIFVVVLVTIGQIVLWTWVVLRLRNKLPQNTTWSIFNDYSGKTSDRWFGTRDRWFKPRS